MKLINTTDQMLEIVPGLSVEPGQELPIDRRAFHSLRRSSHKLREYIASGAIRGAPEPQEGITPPEPLPGAASDEKSGVSGPLRPLEEVLTQRVETALGLRDEGDEG